MTLSVAHKNFLETEFGLSVTQVADMGIEQLRNIREMCFDIEVSEAVVADNDNTDVSERGEIAAELVNIIKSAIKSNKAAALAV